ncbi:unnamed protein product, partial [marine sediment metagenome]
MGPPEVLEKKKERVNVPDWNTVDAAVDWLRTEARGYRPFLLWVGLSAPHPEFRTSRHYLNLIDESRVELPPKDENPHPVLIYQRQNKNWMHGFSHETVRLVRRIYFAMIAELDAMVGRILDAVDQAGVADSTYVIFSSDHGELAMEHRQFY